MKRTTSIDQIFRPLSECQVQSALTNTVQIADILEWVLQQIGPSEVWQTSFSISEEFLRRLYFITRGGSATDIHLVLDFKATNKTLSLWVFIQQVIASTHLADNHSKVLLVKAQSGVKVSIITSQNLTRGNRNESYIITTDEGVFDKFLTEVQDLIKNHSVPLSEILKQRVSNISLDIPEGVSEGYPNPKTQNTMNFSKDDLEKIEKFASIYLPITDIALLMGVPADLLRDEIRNKNTPASQAYHMGKASSRVTLHKQEMLLAQVGSPLALENARKNLMDMEDDE